MQSCKHRHKWFAAHLSQQIKIPSTLYQENVDSKNRAHWIKEIRLETEFQSKITMGLINLNLTNISNFQNCFDD